MEPKVAVRVAGRRWEESVQLVLLPLQLLELTIKYGEPILLAVLLDDHRGEFFRNCNCEKVGIMWGRCSGTVYAPI